MDLSAGEAAPIRPVGAALMVIFLLSVGLWGAVWLAVSAWAAMWPW